MSAMAVNTSARDPTVKQATSTNHIIFTISATKEDTHITVHTFKVQNKSRYPVISKSWVLYWQKRSIGKMSTYCIAIPVPYR